MAGLQKDHQNKNFPMHACVGCYETTLAYLKAFNSQMKTFFAFVLPKLETQQPLHATSLQYFEPRQDYASFIPRR